MLGQLAVAFGLMSLCVVIHALGLAAAFRRRHAWLARPQTFRRITGTLITVAAGVILLHLVEITAWALFYSWAQAMPDMNTSIYFSAVTYTTVGYGDVVLPKEWRLVGGIEALTGILMCGWSTAFFFAVASRMYRA